MFIIPQDGSNRLPNPVKVYERLIELPEHAHLFEHQPAVAFLFREDGLVKQGRRVLGTCYMPRVQGDLRPLFDWMLERMLGYSPIFLFILDLEFWRDSTDREREILVFHEMSHAAQARDEHGEPRFNRVTGAPIWTIRGHDIEEFNQVVERYGAWGTDLQAFLAAAQIGNETIERVGGARVGRQSPASDGPGEPSEAGAPIAGA
jgi:Putative phage metallopeptidase